MFTSILDSAEGFPIGAAVLTTVCSILFGFLIAAVYMSKGKYTKSYVTALVLLPVIVQVIIMMVNGSVGAGIATAGAFSLVRFRSQPASAKETSTIFLAMAVGLSNAMGYLTFSLFVTAVFCLLMFVLEHTKFGEKKSNERSIKIVIPESLDYTEVFDDLFPIYLKNIQLDMGSMFELTYMAEFISEDRQKEFIDAVRCRNGNLTVLVSRQVAEKEEL